MRPFFFLLFLTLDGLDKAARFFPFFLHSTVLTTRLVFSTLDRLDHAASFFSTLDRLDNAAILLFIIYIYIFNTRCSRQRGSFFLHSTVLTTRLVFSTLDRLDHTASFFVHSTVLTTRLAFLYTQPS